MRIFIVEGNEIGRFRFVPVFDLNGNQTDYYRFKGGRVGTPAGVWGSTEDYQVQLLPADTLFRGDDIPDYFVYDPNCGVYFAPQPGDK